MELTSWQIYDIARIIEFSTGVTDPNNLIDLSGNALMIGKVDY